MQDIGTDGRIDAALALSAPPVEVPVSWDADRVILYHLGLGAGVPPTDARELRYVYEEGLQVLPTFGVVAVQQASRHGTTVPGLVYDPAMLLHGEQELVVHRPLPPRASVTATARLAALYDKGKAAVAWVEVEAADADGPMFTARYGVFLRGAGGFGGDPGPRSEWSAPERPPDGEWAQPVLPQQALLYRLSGDKNPLHADPAFAARAGFDRPILHGLCTYGMACKVLVDRLLDGDATRVRGWRTRFAGSVFPGETLVTRAWVDGSTVTVTAGLREREIPVLTHATMEVA